MSSDTRPPKKTGLGEKGVLTGPSGTNPIGLVKHLGHVERYTFHADPDETLDSVVAANREATTRANEVITGDGLDILRELADGATGR